MINTGSIFYLRCIVFTGKLWLTLCERSEKRTVKKNATVQSGLSMGDSDSSVSDGDCPSSGIVLFVNLLNYYSDCRWGNGGSGVGELREWKENKKGRKREGTTLSALSAHCVVPSASVRSDL